jgi:pyridoxine/pyridoxamine 5'-phosphate oxidase
VIFDRAPDDPLTVFSAWLKDAEEQEPNDHNAVTVACVGADGMPSVRMVLLKGYDSEGFVFFTNYESRKGQQILAHPKAALLFHWKSLRRQVRIEGEVEKVSDAEADDYFATRARQSQIGAWTTISPPGRCRARSAPGRVSSRVRSRAASSWKSVWHSTPPSMPWEKCPARRTGRGFASCPD